MILLAMMADRHKRKPRSVRLPEDLEQRIDKMAAERDTTFNAIVVEAVRLMVGGSTAPAAVYREPVVAPQARPYSKEQQTRGKR